jgi:hypothetical protein
MGRTLNLDDPEYWWSRAQQAKAEAEWMPDPDTTRIMSGIAQSYEQIAQRIEVRARRRRYAPALEDMEQLRPAPLSAVAPKSPVGGDVT